MIIEKVRRLINSWLDENCYLITLDETEQLIQRLW